MESYDLQSSSSGKASRIISSEVTTDGYTIQSTVQQAVQRARNATTAHHAHQSAQAAPSHQYCNAPMQVNDTTRQQTDSQYNQSNTVDLNAESDPRSGNQHGIEVSTKSKMVQEAKEARGAEDKTRENADVFKEKDQAGKTEGVRKEEEDRKREEVRKADSEQQKGNLQQGTGKEKSTSSITPATSIGHNANPAPNVSLDLTQMINGAAEGENPEAQIKALMAMVKIMNDKHPSLLAKIWEQERQEHLRKTASQSPVVTTSQPVTQTPTAPSTHTTVSNESTTLPSTNGSRANVRPASPKQPGVPKHPTPRELPSGTPVSTQTQQPVQKLATSVSRSTIWPKGKKGQLAALAAAWLNNNSTNRQNPIHPSKIAEILDQLPTYVELCERLEAMGLRLDRAAFARALLSVAPEEPKTPSSTLASTTSKPPASPGATNGATAPVPQSQPPAAGAGRTQPNAAFKPQPLNQYKRPQLDANAQPIPLPIQPPILPTPPSSVLVGRPDGAGFLKADSMPLEPTSKNQAAKKRTFADIWDLTTLSADDEPIVPPTKMPRTESSAPLPVTKPAQAYQLPPGNLHLNQQHRDHYASRPQPPSRLIDEKFRGLELVKPIRKEKALRRSSYDVNTIARDVLLATGKHPDMLPLNWHLEPLRLAFHRQIDFAADLETIRWDVIDPGEPIPLAAMASLVAGDDDCDSVLDDADDESEHEHFRTQVQAPANRNVVGWNGLVSIAPVVQPQTVEMRKSGDPGGVLKRRRGKPPGNRMSDSTRLQSRPVGNGEDQRTSSRQQGTSNQQPPNVPSNTNRTASIASGSQSTLTHRAPATPQSIPTAPGYAAFKRTDEHGNPVKKKGRPVGWRKSLHQKGVGVYAGGSGDWMPSTSSTARKAGSESSTPKAPEIKYPVYKCKWKDCKAELHNLETLTRHLNILHGKVDEKGRFPCKWMDCAKNVQIVDQATGKVKTVEQHHHFPDFTLWAKHVKEAHVNPVAWKLGDGPPGGVSDSNMTDSGAYLSDARGRRVTPRITAPESSTATPSGPAVVQRGRPPKNTPEQKAREEQAKATARKKAIGPGMDRGGATLANEKRRAGFVDDEEDEVIVDDE